MKVFNSEKKQTNDFVIPSQQIHKVNQKDSRLLTVKIVLLLLFAIASLRLLQIQVIEAPSYQDIARKQYEAKMILPAERGIMYDRNGNVLVSNSQYVSFAADPKIVGNDVKEVAKKFSAMFGKPESEYIEKLRVKKRFVWMERYVRSDIAEKFFEKKIEGIVEVKEPKRLYHYDETAGQVLGIINAEGKGVSGAEFTFNKKLRGEDGFVIMQKDGRGNKRPSVEYPRQEPISGNSLSLTIDITYQSIVEEELRKGVERTNSDAGIAVMVQPKTGEILAMANYPSVNPNKVTNLEVLKNRTIADMYEPGSVFKIVTVTTALQHKLVTLDKVFNVENGRYKIALTKNESRVITDFHPFKTLTFAEGVAQSSNIMMAKLSNTIGPERLYAQAKNFGFGMPTGIELSGEVSGDVKSPEEWSQTTLNTMAYGYEVGVTPLQMAMAYAAIANDGVLMKPYIIQKETDASGDVVYSGEAQPVRRVIPKDIAQTMKDLLVKVVEEGTGDGAKIPGTSIAGKTGTSRKYVNGKYEEGSYTASFVGFYPAENPEIVCLVILDKPKVGGYTGGTTSAPIFKAIAERIINNKGMFTSVEKPKEEQEEKFEEIKTPGKIPDVQNIAVEEAKEILEENKLRYKISGKGTIVQKQSPLPGKIAKEKDIVQLTLVDTSIVHRVVTVPNVCGMSIRQAMNTLTAKNVKVVFAGSGVVIRQTPTAGTALKNGMKVMLYCEPKTIALQ